MARDKSWSVFKSSERILVDWTRELNMMQSYITDGRLGDKQLLNQMNVVDYFAEVDTYMAKKDAERKAFEKMQKKT